MVRPSPLPFRGILLSCFLLSAASFLPQQAFSVPKNANEEAVSDRAAAVTNQGVQGTVSGGSSRNPQINDLVTVQDMAGMQGDLKHLNRLLKELGMAFYLEQSRDMTMFMPVDAAFSQLPFDLHELSWQAKWRILQFHVIPNDVVDLDNELRDRVEKQFESWEGAPIKVAKIESPGSSREFLVNGEAKIISKPPKIETFNGAAYKINKVMIPPSMSEEDLKPATREQRVNPEINQRLRKRPASEGTPSVAVEQQHASVDGTVNMERSARDPRLPGSFRPDPLAQRSQVTPDFLKGINSQHSRWDDAVYRRVPRTHAQDERKPQDEILGFNQQASLPEESGNQTGIKVLGRDGVKPTMTHINSNTPPSSSTGTTFESALNPSAEEDPVGHFMNVLIGGPASRKPSSLSSSSLPSVSSPSSSSAEEKEESLFNKKMTPTQGPKVKALGLTEGLLPAEELITHHWAKPNNAGIQKQQHRSSSLSPLAALWQQINVP